jgi:hypothetical protein
MKLRFKNYAVIITIENRCIRFNNYNLNSLYKYDIAKKLFYFHCIKLHLSQCNVS